MENLNVVVPVQETEIALTAHNLSDRSMNENSLRHAEHVIRSMYVEGESIRSIARKFRKSYEWVRRIAKDVAYDYDDVTVEQAVEDVPELVVAF